MLLEKETIKCEVAYSDDRKHRYMLKRVWNKEKPIACVITIQPSMANNLSMDMTTFLTINGVTNLEDYGGIIIVNLFSILTTKLNFRSPELLNDVSNDVYIKKAAEEASVVILAWGKSATTNMKLYHRSEQVLELLEAYKEKLRVISDGVREGCHPLTPSLRARWALVGVDEWLKEYKEQAHKREEKENAKEKLAEREETATEEA
jgi:hypothetical protein